MSHEFEWLFLQFIMKIINKNDDDDVIFARFLHVPLHLGNMICGHHKASFMMV